MMDVVEIRCGDTYLGIYLRCLRVSRVFADVFSLRWR